MSNNLEKLVAYHQLALLFDIDGLQVVFKKCVWVSEEASEKPLSGFDFYINATGAGCSRLLGWRVRSTGTTVASFAQLPRCVNYAEQVPQKQIKTVYGRSPSIVINTSGRPCSN